MYKLKFRKICSAAGYDTQGLRPKECIFSTYKHPSSRSRKRFSAKTEYQHFTNIEHKVGKILKLIHNNGQAKKALQEAGTANEHNKELSALIKVHELHDTQASAHMKELEEQLATLKTEMDSLYNLKKGLEVQIENKAAKAKQLQEKKSQLLSWVSELELMSKEKGDEISTIQKKMKDNEMNFTSRIEDLMTQVKILQLETVSLHSQNGKLKAETLEGEIARKAMTEQELKEKETFLVRRYDQGLEANSLRNQKNRMEELIRSKNQVADQLREEGERMHTRIFELEGNLLDRGGSFSPCLKEYESRVNEASTQIIALRSERILVSEQIHAETKDGYKKMKERLDQENIELNDKASAFEAELRKIREMLLEPVEDAFSGAEALQLKGKEEKELLLGEEVGKLKAKLCKEGGDKLNSVSQLEIKVVYLEQQVKDKEEVLLGLSEERREAIRQLCILIDYHRGRYDHLREAISKKTVHIKRMA
uniref:NAB domain-containing protein n=1 Tax=Populus trichocarpa TaxID=3694 RepID=B9GL86_POPTR